MDLELLRDFLGWCSIINLGLLLWWWGWFALAHEQVYRLHGRWFRIPVECFDAIHYGAMAVFKLGVFLFNVVPYLVLRFLVSA
ncbi:MAG: DUF6868 family protein [Planctomycetota bacterium]|jgi:hypothetical protein